MNTRLVWLLHIAGALSTATLVHAQGSAFTYQGRLNVNGAPASGTYDFRYRLALDPYGNNYFGLSVLASGQVISNGLFTATLDFGAGAFTGGNYWLEVDVKTNGAGGYTALSPLQPVTPAPYAIFSGTSSSAVNATTAATATSATTATTASAVGANGVNGVAIQNNAVTSAKIASGQVVKSLTAGASTLYDNVTLAAGNNVTLTPSGQTVTIAATGGQSWSLSGNSGTTPGTQFVGTTDNQPLEFRVNGQRVLRLESNSGGTANIIGGCSNNVVDAGVVGAFIGGGGAANYFGFSATNRISANGGTIGGGSGNTIQTNTIGQYAPSSTIGGGGNNTIQTNALEATIAGGGYNSIQAGNTFGTIGGGFFNTIQTISGQAAHYAVIGGGLYNTNGGLWATIPGGRLNLATGNYGFAAGYQAQSLHQGAFVWADSQNLPFASTGSDTVSFRCQGGVRFTSGSGAGNQTVSWTPGSGSWSFSSDRNLKEGISAVDAQSVLEKVARLPIAEWNYIGYSERHIGPMAQDFHAFFPLNENDKVLNEADLHGVELTAIQGLNQKLEALVKQKNGEIETLKAITDELKLRLSSLEQVLNSKHSANP